MGTELHKWVPQIARMMIRKKKHKNILFIVWIMCNVCNNVLFTILQP